MANIKPKWEEEHPPMKLIMGDKYASSARLPLSTIRYMSRDEVRRIRASARQEIGR